MLENSVELTNETIESRFINRETREPGYVTNYENILFDREGGYTASYMETLLMGPERIEALSRHTRELTVLPG